MGAARLQVALVVGLLGLHAALVLDFARKHSAVFDEVVYPTSGYSYWLTGDYRLNPEHPPLLKLWTALPWLGIGARAERIPGWWETDQWRFGQALLFESGWSAGALLLRARLMTALLSLGLALGVWSLGRQLFGAGAGLAALALYALDPLVIAHAGLATTDLGAAALYAFAVVAFARAVSSARTGRFAWAGGVLGAALGAKFSMLVLVPLLAVVVLLLAPPGRRARAAAGSLLAGAAAAVVLAALYRGEVGAYFEGLRRLLHHSQVGHPSYAFGQYSRQGWWWYFPAAWLVKTPVPLLAFAVGGSALALLGILKTRRGAVREGPQAGQASRDGEALPGRAPLPDRRWSAVLLLAVACAWLPVMASSLNLGVRHLLPATPFLAVLGGAAAARWARAAYGRWLVAGAFGWLAAATFLVHPHELSFASPLFGGPGRAWRYLADSNVDWGQDLPALEQELERYPLRRLYLGYFGTAYPEAYGIERYHWIPSFGMVPRKREDGPAPEGREWIAISVTNLLDVYSGKHEGYAWLRERPFAAFPGRSIALFDITADAEAHRRLGETALYYGEPQAARAPLERALELRPHDPRARAALLRGLVQLGLNDDAARICQGISGEETTELTTLCRELARHRVSGR